MSDEPPKTSGVLGCRAEKSDDEPPVAGRRLVWIVLAIIFVAEVAGMLWFAGIFRARPKAKGDDRPAGAAQVQRR